MSSLPRPDVEAPRTSEAGGTRPTAFNEGSVEGGEDTGPAGGRGLEGSWRAARQDAACSPGGCENASPAPARCLSAWAVPSLPLVRVNSSPRKGPESDFGSRAPRSGPRPRTGGSARPGPVTRYSGNRNWTPRRLHAPQTLVLPAIRAAPGPPWGPRVQARDSGQRPTTAPLPGRQLWAGRGSGQLTYPRDAVPRAAGRGPCGARQSLLRRPGRRYVCTWSLWKKKEEREVGTKNVFEEVMTKKTLSFMKTINP